MLTATGHGCNGSNYGVNVYMHDPGSTGPSPDPPPAANSGQAPPDGPWSILIEAPRTPGTYVAEASCFDVGTQKAVLTYASQPFTVFPS